MTAVLRVNGELCYLVVLQRIIRMPRLSHYPAATI
jgi:hypothetical protein